MARAGRKKKTRKKARGGPTLLARIRASLASLPWPAQGPYWRGAAWLVGLGGLTAAAVIGVPRLQASVVGTLPATDVTIEFIDRPAWVHGDLLDWLDITARPPLTGSPLDSGGLIAAREALLDTGWFDAVEQVRRHAGGRVTIEAIFVTPAAVVRDGAGDHLVDFAGRLLPRTYPRDGAEHQLVITGAHFDRPARPGVQWDGADVSAALRLLRVIDARPWRGQVEAIDAGGYLADETLVLVTDLGARIIWGSAPGDESGLEVTNERKLGYLDTAYREFGRIDTGHDGPLRFYERGYFSTLR